MNDGGSADILIIDDDEAVVRILTAHLTRMGHRVMSAHSLNRGRAIVRDTAFDVILLDVEFPDGSGLDFLSDLRETGCPSQVIVMTSFPDPTGAETAIRKGAWDYLEKPASLESLKAHLERALAYSRQHPRQPVRFKSDRIVGSSPRMRDCFETAASAAACDANVLLTGETGTGKELFARAIHENSRRSPADFIVVDCGILTESLLESTLFGHEKGSFTGADNRRTGLVRLADGGTLFLDEIGELPLSVQKAFLRVLQDHRYRPVRSRQENHSDFRLICATNQDLEKMVDQGRFRKDLFFRINTIRINIPALRDRIEDIPELAAFHIDRICRRHGIPPKRQTPEFSAALTAYPWPGNVREMVNILDSAIASTRYEDSLFPIHLPKGIRIYMAQKSLTPKPAANAAPLGNRAASEFPLLRDYIADMESRYFSGLIRATGGDVRELCRVSGISRTMVYARLKKYGLSRK